MAIKGLSKPYFGNYAINASGAAEYTEGVSGGEAIEYSASIETSDDNPLYADNNIKENDHGTFSSGTLSLGTADLTAAASKFLLGAKTVTRTMGEKTVSETVYDDDAKATPKGFGIIEMHQINNSDTFRAVILCKVIMNIPEDAATTKGESVDWQTKTIEGTIQRSDENTANYKHPWKIEAWFATEEEAEEYLKTVLGVE